MINIMLSFCTIPLTNLLKTANYPRNHLFLLFRTEMTILLGAFGNDKKQTTYCSEFI